MQAWTRRNKLFATPYSRRVIFLLQPHIHDASAQAYGSEGIIAFGRMFGNGRETALTNANNAEREEVQRDPFLQRRTTTS